MDRRIAKNRKAQKDDDEKKRGLEVIWPSKKASNVSEQASMQANKQQSSQN